MAGHRKHKGGHHEEEHENEERWLVSFADMMTLLFALFMVLFSISSVNTSKFEALQKSLNDAFSGAVLDGGKSMLNSGSSADETEQSSVQPPLPALRPDRPCCSTIAAARPRSSGPTRGISLAAGPLAFRTLPRETIRQS